MTNDSSNPQPIASERATGEPCEQETCNCANKLLAQIITVCKEYDASGNEIGYTRRCSCGYSVRFSHLPNGNVHLKATQS